MLSSLNNKYISILVLFMIITFSSTTLGMGKTTSFFKGNTATEEAEQSAPYYISSKGILGDKDYGVIAEIADKVGPAVVNIDVEKMERAAGFNPFGDFGFELDPEFKHFFEDKLIPIKGAGSGFIINNKGYILTNSHVVKGAEKIKITLKDGRNFDGKVIGSDSTLDIAVLKIQADKLPVAVLGDSAKIKPGQWVVAIGNPYQFQNTVTVGIISATGRTLNDIGRSDLIQTDAAINPGNSGGPLINLAGEVIGINVAIAAGAQGIGFAIPINAAKDAIGVLIAKGKIIRPWIGVYMRDVDAKVAEYLDLPFAEGVVITEIVPDSPAAKAGIRKYDVILKVNDQSYKSGSEISKFIKSLKPGDQVNLEVFRDGHRATISVKIGEAP
ncbi:MAG: trypsin-like peptidase domain-containing protein [Candidatus Saganbacteria bacterium]|nr:trypsin-like peptidase domain-containing protein [Candidatus Saganbacteria bacterium]